MSDYYPTYLGKSTEIINALISVGESNTSFSHRKRIATINGIFNYMGMPPQNTKMLNLLRRGVLKRG